MVLDGAEWLNGAADWAGLRFLARPWWSFVDSTATQHKERETTTMTTRCCADGSRDARVEKGVQSWTRTRRCSFLALSFYLSSLSRQTDWAAEAESHTRRWAPALGGPGPRLHRPFPTVAMPCSRPEGAPRPKQKRADGRTDDGQDRTGQHRTAQDRPWPRRQGREGRMLVGIPMGSRARRESWRDRMTMGDATIIGSAPQATVTLRRLWSRGLQAARWDERGIGRIDLAMLSALGNVYVYTALYSTVLYCRGKG